MYLRKIKKKSKGKTYIHYALVESVYTPKGPRQRIICSLGDLSPGSKEHWLEVARKLEAGLAASPAGPRPFQRVKAPVEPACETVSVKPGETRVEHSRPAGDLAVALEFWRRLGVDLILKSAGLNQRARTIVCVLTLNRFVRPVPDSDLLAWAESTALLDLLDTPREWLRREAVEHTLEQLPAVKAAVEKQLADQEHEILTSDNQARFSTVFCLDGCHWGYERNCMVGVGFNPDGLPLLHQTYLSRGSPWHAGIEGLLRALSPHGDAFGEWVILPRSMASAVRFLSAGVKCAVFCSPAQRDLWLPEFAGLEIESAPERQFGLPEFGRGYTMLAARSCRRDSTTYVICSELRQRHREELSRIAQEREFQSDICALQSALRAGQLQDPDLISELIQSLRRHYFRPGGYYDLTYTPGAHALHYAVNVERRAAAQMWDGATLFRTAEPSPDPAELWVMADAAARTASEAARVLARVRSSPRACSVEAQVFISLLAQRLQGWISKALSASAQRPLPVWSRLHRLLYAHHMATVALAVAGGGTMRIRMPVSAEEQQQSVYRQLGMDADLTVPRARCESGSPSDR